MIKKNVSLKYLKQALNHGLVFKKWTGSLISINTEQRKKAKNYFVKDFLKLMNNAVSIKTMKNLRKHRDIKLFITESRKNYLVSEPNYHKAKGFSDNLLAIETKGSQILYVLIILECVLEGIHTL